MTDIFMLRGKKMIPFNFTYYRPDSLEEAVRIHSELTSKGLSAVYYSGGSEIITMCRAGSIRPDAVIDIKEIPELKSLAMDESCLRIGSACTLYKIKQSKAYPLLALACGRIADHTNQCRITLGGNICGTIIYKETVPPLLLSDAEVTLLGSEGKRTVPFSDVFDGRIHLLPSELLVSAQIPKWALSAQHFHIKLTAQEKIDYPLVSIAALIKDNFLRIAFSGVCSFPFRSQQIELVLNNKSLSISERAERAASLIPEEYSDRAGSAEYRRFVFKNAIEELLEEWENG